MTAEKFHDAITLLPSDLIAEADKKRQKKPAVKVIPWKRYAAMAACFVLVLSSAWFVSLVFPPRGATESAMEAAAEAPAAAAPMDQAAQEAPAAADIPAAEEASEEKNSASISGSGSGVLTDDTVGELPAAPEPEEVRRDTADIIRYRVETPLKPSTACFSSNSVITLIHSLSELEDYLIGKDWIYDFTGFSAVRERYDEDWFEECDLLLVAMLDIPSNSDPHITALNQNERIWELCFAYNLTPAEEEPTSSAWHFLVEVEKDQIPDADSVMLIFE